MQAGFVEKPLLEDIKLTLGTVATQARSISDPGRSEVGRSISLLRLNFDQVEAKHVLAVNSIVHVQLTLAQC